MMMKYYVLILVLLEHAQREEYEDYINSIENVLILVLLEHAQRAEWDKYTTLHLERCLNPCFIGTCSKRTKDDHMLRIAPLLS